MKLVLSEAERLEGGRGVMRPIVANLLGIILQRMPFHPTLWKQRGDLLRAYVREAIRGELKEDVAIRGELPGGRSPGAAQLGRGLWTAQPRAVSELAQETLHPTLPWRPNSKSLVMLDCYAVSILIKNISSQTWQISHNFLATAIEGVLDGLHRTLWRAVRPSACSCCRPFVLLLALSVWALAQKEQT